MSASTQIALTEDVVPVGYGAFKPFSVATAAWKEGDVKHYETKVFFPLGEAYENYTTTYGCIEAALAGHEAIVQEVRDDHARLQEAIMATAADLAALDHKLSGEHERECLS